MKLTACAHLVYNKNINRFIGVLHMADVIKQERIHIRIDTNAKAKLEKAAQFVHKTLSDFVLSHALDSADSVIAEHEKLQLSQNDWEVFLNALDNPPQPNKDLKKAFQLHKENVIQ